MSEWRTPSIPEDPVAGTPPVRMVLLILTIAVALTPHVAVLAPWVSLSVAVAIVWRLGVATGRWRLPGRLVRGLATFALSFGVVFTYRGISGVDAGSALLIAMMALKLLETRNHRDRSIVVLIAWFVLFAGFLRDQTLVSVGQLGTGVVVGTLALVHSTCSAVPLSIGRGLAITGRLLAHAAPLALVLFLLFPRLPGPFWAIPKSDMQARSGLSDTMSPGDITALALSDDVAFRVRFDGDPPPQRDLYWRGPVLESFDGRRWRSLRGATPRPQAVLERDGTTGPAAVGDGGRGAVSYEIILEPRGARWLLPLETPLSWDAPDGRLSSAMELVNARPIERRLAWRGRSLPGSATAADEPDPSTRRYAITRNPRTQALARELRDTAGSDRAFLLGILRMFREQPFRYTLQPPALAENPVDAFLFATQAGFCEHYASAFAVLARAGGLPARVVTGYQGGERNPLGDYWIVRQSNAHAWTEVWLDDHWVRFDPTAAVAPERIETGMEAALPGFGGSVLPLLGEGRWLNALLSGMELRWDALNAAWDYWVLAFGPEQQRELIERLGIDAPALRDVALVCAAAFGSMLLLFTLLQLRRPRPTSDPVELEWQRLCRRLARVTRPRNPAETPAEYAAAVGGVRPDLADGVHSLTEHYLRLRYDGPASVAQAMNFRRRVRRFRVAPEPAPG